MKEKPEHISQRDWDDVDSPEWTDEMWENAKPAKDVLPPAFLKALKEGRVGRPSSDKPKEKTTIRLDVDLLESLRSLGKGWQTRVNEELRKTFL